MPDPRTIAAVRAACPRNDEACVYPGCTCTVPIVVRHALAGADAWEATQRFSMGLSGVGMLLCPRLGACT
jgi:hypothetical protein